MKLSTTKQQTYMKFVYETFMTYMKHFSVLKML